MIQVSLILIACLWIYWPAVHGGWLWDDDIYVRQNPLLNDPDRLWKIWFLPGSLVEYYPLEESVLWVQWHLWHAEPLGYHLTNLALHAINSLLVWRLLSKVGLRLAWLSGLLFAVHPLQVESVAWVAELKNTLSMAPLLLAMAAWVDYENDRRKEAYWQAFGFFLTAMLCKVSMAPLPVVLLLYAWWKRGAITIADFMNALPFLGVALVLGATTIRAGELYAQSRFLQPVEVPLHEIVERLSCAGQALAFYFSHVVFPLTPLPIYPQWPIDGSSITQFVPWLVMAMMFAALWIKRRDWGRHALLGLGFFCFFLLPFIGFEPVSFMKFSWVMDHFLYIPIIGLIGLFVAAIDHLDQLLPLAIRRGALGVLVIYFCALAWNSHLYAANYQSLETLSSYAIEHNPDAWMGYQNMGGVRNEQRRFEEAIGYFEKAVQLNPRIVLTRINLARALHNAGRYEESESQYREALRIWPKSSDAQLDLGELLTGLGKNDKAITHYQTYLRLNPDSSLLHLNLGNAFFQEGRFPEAIEHYKSAAQLDPSLALVHYNWGKSLRQLNRLPEAAEQYQLAINLNPQYADAHNNLGVVFYLMGNIPGAIHEYEETLRLNPDCVDAQNNLNSLRSQER